MASSPRHHSLRVPTSASIPEDDLYEGYQSKTEDHRDPARGHISSRFSGGTSSTFSGSLSNWNSGWGEQQRSLGDVAHRDNGSWGFAYPSAEEGLPARIGGFSSQESAGDLDTTPSVQEKIVHEEEEDEFPRRLSVSTVDSDPDHLYTARGTTRAIDLVSLQKSFSGKTGEDTMQRAVPLQAWYRAVMSMFQLVVGTCCIQVGFKEEDRICEATFCSLLIVCGFVTLVQAMVGVFFILKDIGIQGEEARGILLLVEFLLWVSVLHAVVTTACENLKLQAMASIYLLSCALFWVANSTLWLSVFMALEQEAVETSPMTLLGDDHIIIDAHRTQSCDDRSSDVEDSEPQMK